MSRFSRIAAFLCLPVAASLTAQGAPSFSFDQERAVTKVLAETSTAAPSGPRDILFLFVTPQDHSSAFGKRLREILRPGSPLEKELSGQFRICKLVLDPAEPKKEAHGAWILAEAFGVLGTPSLYLSDDKWQPYAHYLGGLKKDVSSREWVESLLKLARQREDRDSLLEKAGAASDKEKGPLLLAALSLAPDESLAACYPGESDSLVQLLPHSPLAKKLHLRRESLRQETEIAKLREKWGNPRFTVKASAEKMLGEVNAYLETIEEKEGSESLKQFILMEYRFPLLVICARYAAEEKPRGVFSAKSDLLMRDALNDLNTVIRMDGQSPYGQEAQKLKSQISAERRKLR